MTLVEKLEDWRESQRRKHDLHEDYVVNSINVLSNYEFLLELSDALEEILNERKNTDTKA
jgi:hypothetical protein